MQSPTLPRRRFLAASAAWLPLAAGLAAADSVPPRTRPFVSPRFKLDLPEKDWRVVGGGVNTLATLVQKDGASVVIEQETLQIALAPEEIDNNFVQLEVGAIQEREIAGSGFQGKVIGRGRQPVVVIDYQRRGFAGPEVVRLFVSISGQRLTRLVCSAPPALFTKLEATFTQISVSVQPVEQTK